MTGNGISEDDRRRGELMKYISSFHFSDPLEYYFSLCTIPLVIQSLLATINLARRYN